MTITQFIHTPFDGHLGRFQIFANTNKDVTNLEVQAFCGHMFSFFLSKYLSKIAHIRLREYSTLLESAK